MPNYDTECSDCGNAANIDIKLDALAAWDKAAICPSCSSGSYGRVLRHSPVSFGGPKATAKSITSKNRGITNIDRDIRGQAIEDVRTGKFEGF